MLPITSFKASEILIVCSFVFFLGWYLKFLWSRRFLYYYGRKVNGPFALPFIGILHKFLPPNGIRINNIIGQFADQYSGLCSMWLGPNLVFVIAIPEHVDKILTSPNALDKADYYDNFHLAVNQSVFTSTASLWKAKRKLISAFFVRKNLNDFMKTTAKCVEETTDEIKEKLVNGEEADVVTAIITNSIFISLGTAFGEKPEALINGEYNYDIIDRVMEVLFQRIYILPYRYDTIFAMSPIGKSTINLINSVRRNFKDLIESRRKQIYQEEKINGTVDQRPTLMDHLLIAFKGNTGISIDNQTNLIIDEIITFITASADSSSNVTNFVLLMLGLFPEVQENVYKEVVTIYGKSEPIEWKKINELNYLDRVFKETIRLFPPVPLLGRKLTGDIELDNGIILPKGSNAGIPILHIQRSEKYWHDPLTFDPDRFLPDNVTKRHHCTYLPFLHGPRNCPGMVHAQIGIRVIIAHLIREFCISTDYKRFEDVELDADMLLRPKDGFKLHMKLRK